MSGHYTVLRLLCGVPFQHRDLLGPTFLRVMTVSLWQWTPNVITTCWKPFSYPRWNVATGIWRERGFSTNLNEHLTCCIPRATSLSVWWHSVAPQFTGTYCSWHFLWGYLKAQVLLTPSLTLTALNMQFVRRLQMLCRTLYVTSWQVYLGDGSNALIVMEGISKTLYWRCEAFCKSKTLTYLTVFSCIYCCVQ